MADVGLAAEALLVAVGLAGEGEGGRDRTEVGLRVALVQLVLHLLQGPLHARRAEVLGLARPGAPLGPGLARADGLGGGLFGGGLVIVVRV